MLEQLRKYRRDLHRIPEIMFDLPKTRACILDALRGVNAEIEITEQGGVTALFDLGKSYAMAFRADMDALTVSEQTGVDFSSEHEGKMHACGHDGHMAMLLSFCHWVDAHAQELNCNILAVFQPAEESGGGAEHIAKSGIFQKYNVRGIYALHVDPAFAPGVIATRPGAFMAKSSEVYITVHGKASQVRPDEIGCGAQYHFRSNRADRHHARLQHGYLQLDENAALRTGARVRGEIRREGRYLHDERLSAGHQRCRAV